MRMDEQKIAKRQSWVELLYLGAWVSVVCLILYSFLKNCFQHYREDARNNDPPPPYRPSGGFGGGSGGPGFGGGGSGGRGGWNEYKPSGNLNDNQYSIWFSLVPNIYMVQ